MCHYEILDLETIKEVEDYHDLLPCITESMQENSAKESGEVYIFPTLEDFAIYEVENGWYANFLGSALTTDFRGAPDLLNFIDYKSLGYALIRTWDESCHLYIKEHDTVVQFVY